MSYVQIRNLYFTYRSHNNDTEFELSIENLEIEKGNFVSILGPNGSGKSTILKIIAGLLPYKTGSIIVDGIELNKYTEKEYSKIVAYVPQKTYTIFPFSVYEIVMMGRTPYQNLLAFENKSDLEIVNYAMELLGISHLKKKGINEISGGELQRVFIARALAQEPRIILLDEPNAHLDLEHQISIFTMLKKMNTEQNLTIINISHDLNLVGIYSSEIILMKNGKIASHGNKTTMLSEQNIKNIFNVDAEIVYSDNGNISNVIVKPFKIRK